MMPIEIVRTYLSAVGDIHATGAASPETSYYPALANLLNAVGDALKPKVRCVMNLKNLGNGMPDGGLFTADQLARRTVDAVVQAGQLPARGAIEVKGAKAMLDVLATSDQVAGYLKTYGIVLIANLRQFAVVDAHGIREQFSLADTADAFWSQVAAHPQASAERLGKPMAEFLTRACLHEAPLSTPKDLAWFLASYARDALDRVERQSALPALQSVRASLEQALGITFTGPDGEHFFRSTLVQTLFYGVFSGWVQWCREQPLLAATFDWRNAGWTLHVPFVRSLFATLATKEKLGPLKLVEPLDWAAAALNRVDRAAFFGRFEDRHAVQYFYEPFLEAYDPKLRKELGVWYTPPEVVQYQVARVDRVLRDELGLADGLAHKDVVVLDPCCGTGAYLVEVLRTIARTLRDNGDDALVASELKQAAKTRIFGFEIMPAPFVVAHLQLGLLLQQEGSPLDHDSEERVGVYLTNALTGWDPLAPGQQQVMGWMELQQERDAAAAVKQSKKILVILGNPPYNAFAGVSPVEEKGLVDAYKVGLNTSVAQGGWGIRKFNLDDLYVRFFRLAERRIAEMSGRGVVSFISNFSYLSDPSFVVMRQRFLTEFDKLWFDCLNGDSRETGKLTPDGQPDPSVFSTEYNREGIRVGTAIATMVRKIERHKSPIVLFQQFWGATKRADLSSAATMTTDSAYEASSPTQNNRFTFRAETVDSKYSGWPRLSEMPGEPPVTGYKENRTFGMICSERDVLATRMQAYFDPSVPWSAVTGLDSGLSVPASDYNPEQFRPRALKSEQYSEDKIKRYVLRPFEVRWCFFPNTPGLWNRNRPSLYRHQKHAIPCLVTRPDASADPEGVPFYFVRTLADFDFIRGHSYHFPLRLAANDNGEHTMFAAGAESANLSAAARAYVSHLKLPNPDVDTRTASLIWMHALAIGYSPAYLSENADGIRRDWPRIPLPATAAALTASAALGERVAALLDTEADVAGVTAGKPSPLLVTVGQLAKVDGTQVNATAGDLDVTAGWGYAGQNGVTMPGRGRVDRRPFNPAEAAAIAAEADAMGLTADALTALLGGDTFDIYLNPKVYWRNVPAAVWEFYIGGYQVMKKWLSYREQPLLGRPLHLAEAREVTAMARRLAGLVMLRPALDANYAAVVADTYPWPGVGT